TRVASCLRSASTQMLVSNKGNGRSRCVTDVTASGSVPTRKRSAGEREAGEPMPAAVVLVVSIAAFALAYRYYSGYLARRVYALDPDFVTPAHTYRDDADFVPTNKHIVFSHHFISVAGAAPIVGPATAVFWGWGPALLWIVFGTIFAAGVHDFGALVISVRHRARSIGTLTGEIITRRARTLFLLIIFFL